jgi:hypothetical protein
MPVRALRYYTWSWAIGEDIATVAAEAYEVIEEDEE